MFPKPQEPDQNDDGIDETQVCEDGNKVNVELLEHVQLLDIDPAVNSRSVSRQTATSMQLRGQGLNHASPQGDIRIEARLGGRTGAEEVRVHRLEVADRVQDNERQDAHDDYVRIYASDVVSQVQFSQRCIGPSVQ